MSNALLIAHGGTAPTDPLLNTPFHQELIDALNIELTRDGWAGASIEHYARSNGYVSIEIVEGENPLTMEALRQFRSSAKAHEKSPDKEASA